LVHSALVARLPASRTPLIGREREIVALHDLLLHADERLLTLTGVGGCGKTRLALALAADLLPVFPRRVWLVELAPIADAALVPITVASVLGLRVVAGSSSLNALVTFLAPQRALLVLDNCEHLIDACASLADHLLATCPALRILTTSRAPLQIAGERQYRVSPLALPNPDAAASVDEIGRSPAVQLFLARARAVSPAFHLDAASAPLVARICARLDGIPLALELAAPWVRVLALEQILVHLDDSVRMLVGGSRAGPTRQQTLRATLDWSDVLLTDAERALFHRLAVFAGEFVLDAVKAIGAGPGLTPPEGLDILTQLVDKSLVVAEGGEDAAWYRLLEPVRQYAMQHLVASGEMEAVEARHAAFYTALAEHAALALHGPEQVEWLARLDREQGNLRATLRWAERRGDAEGALRLATALVPFWEAHGHITEGRRWLQWVLALPADAVAPRTRVRALIGAGLLAYLHAAYAEAETLLVASLTQARESGDRRETAAALTNLGMVHRLQRDLPRSIRCLEEGLALYRTLGDDAGIAFALRNLGSTVLIKGDLPNATRLLEESLAGHTLLGDERAIAITQAMLGMAALQSAERERATDLLLAALRGHARLGDRWFVAFDLLGVAQVLLIRGQPEASARLLGAVEAIGEALGGPIGNVTFGTISERARTLLGAERFAAAWAYGRALPFEQAVAAAFALAAPAPSQPQDAPSPPPDREPLTRREREVAQLLAREFTDRQVADALSISVGTVGVHVHRILQKLGLYSRQQVADRLAGSAPLARDRD
jgi:predicted ATPase/DNA-binding CsgD family transcriptional regulator